MSLPTDLVGLVFGYAFYPHQLPYKSVQRFNTVLKSLPRSVIVSCYFKPKPGWIITHEPFFYAFRGQRSSSYCEEEHVSEFVYEEHELQRLGRVIRFEICTNSRICDKKYVFALRSVY